jgi:hypothetical protein
MSSLTQQWVVRVRGIPTPDLVKAERLLRSVLKDELKEAEEDPKLVKISIVPSCQDDGKTVALINFKSPPDFLSELRTNPLTSLQAELDSGDDVSFDCHFHGFTQLYPAPPIVDVTTE